MLTWVAAGVGCWLLGNVAFVVAVVRIRDRARRASSRTGTSRDDRSKDDGGTSGRGEPVRGAAALRPATPGRGGR